MNVLAAILANFIVVTSALCFGSLLQRLFPKAFSGLDRLLMTLLGGLGILGTILFCVGQIWFSRSAIVLVLVSGVLLGGRSLARAGQELWASRGRVHLPVIPAAIVFTLFLVTAIGGLALPAGDTNDDAIAYHYLGPKVWLRQGVIRAVADEMPTYFPAVVESQYAALMSLGGERAPGFFAIVSLAAILLTSASLAIRLGLDCSGAWWAAALVTTMPALYVGTHGGFLDGLFASFVLAAARLAFDAEQPANYALFGIFCGFAMGTKYTGILAWPLLIFSSFLVSFWAYRRPLATILKSLGIACGVAMAIAAPFYVRNWILYGCPIYPPTPLLLHFFSPRNFSLAVTQSLVEEVRRTGSGMGRGPKEFLLLPFHVTYHSALFRGAGGIGLVPLALGPFGVLARRRDAFAKGLLFFAVLQTAAWFVTAQESRYAIQLYLIAGVFGVVGWQSIARSASRNARVLSAIAVAISILYGLVMILPTRVEDVHAAVSRSYEARRRQEETLCAAAFDYVNGEPSVKGVLLLDPGIAPYFIDKPYVKPFGVWGEQTIPGATDVPEVMAQLPNLHVTHVFDFRWPGGTFHLPGNPPGLTLVFERENQRIYRVD